MSNKKTTNGIIVQDGKWVMLCGSQIYPINYTDKQGKPLPPKKEEAQQ